jgi:hypothetical protein
MAMTCFFLGRVRRCRVGGGGAKPSRNSNRILNGALAIAARAQPVQFGGTVEFRADGSRHETNFAEAAMIERADKNRAVGVVSWPSHWCRG